MDILPDIYDKHQSRDTRLRNVWYVLPDEEINMNERQSKVLEKFYSLRELSFQLGFSERFFAERCKAGDFTLAVEGVTIAEPVEISGEIRVPASAVNAWLTRNPYRYDAGVKARNVAELRRKLASPHIQEAAA
jgi:hypothetical protein